MHGSGVHRAVLGLAVGLLPSLALGQEGQERGIESVEASQPENPDHVLDYGDRHALVIGIDEYADPAFPDLQYAVRDAEAVAQVLIKDFGFPEDNVRLLRNESATRDGLAQALEDWACDPLRVGEHDLIVVFFAGHGVTKDLGTQGKKGFLVPQDARSSKSSGPVKSSLYSMDYLEGTSQAIPGKHALFILDCCFGGLVQDRALLPTAPGLQSRARQILTAGNEHQTVMDGGGDGHSVFAATLLAALDGYADIDGDEVISFGELYQYVASHVENKTENRQTPLQDFFPDHDGGMVALFRPGVKPGRQSITERLKRLKQSDAEKAEEIRLLSDAIEVRDLVEEQRRLWPCRSAKIPGMRAWLTEARDVLGRRLQHQESLTHVREEVHLGQIAAGLITEGSNEEPSWERADRVQRFRYETFKRLVEQQEKLERLIADVQARMDSAADIEQRTLGEFEEEWDDAVFSISESATYDGMDLQPQVGLVPLGPDPESELWEFWHVESGERPERDPRTGRLILGANSGLVLVLIPEGTFWMGAQNTNQHAPYYDEHANDNEGPPREVTVSAFFMSRYEMTQGQWQYLMGENPSRFTQAAIGPQAALHPVERVSWKECRQAMLQGGLMLPTEAQWEYAARAETNTPWWTGLTKATLTQAANLADLTHQKTFVEVRRYEDWEDGYGYHAPVGSFRANRFGLHDVIGNVWEWCADPFSVDRARQTSANQARVVRGGSFYGSATSARSAARGQQVADYRNDLLGLRPAAALATR